MRLFADECTYATTVRLLQQHGYDIASVFDVGLQGQPDIELLRYAVAEQRVIVTNDLDFANIRHYPPSEHCGVIVLRIRPTNQDRVHTLLIEYLAATVSSQIDKCLVIIDQNKCRVRRLQPPLQRTQKGIVND
jgi:predicted nuclease of predicted toxin-antitoxin system